MTNPRELAQLAAQARLQAYAPYSKFKVGAALLTENGEIYTGCNVENASYGMSLCAERVAVCKAVSDGNTSLKAIALSMSGSGSPCGACRQVLYEFNPSIPVYMSDESGNIYRESVLSDLIPDAFGPENLD